MQLLKSDFYIIFGPNIINKNCLLIESQEQKLILMFEKYVQL